MTSKITCLNSAVGEDWAMYHGDCVDVVRQLPDRSVDFSIYSPPFANLYCYSDSDRDMGNCVDDGEFLEQYAHLVAELHRVLRPGRLVAVHCKDLVNYKNRDGMAGLRDFPGDLIRVHQAVGFAYASRVTVWKCPVTEMQRTKAHGLLYKQLRADSTFSRQGLPEYVLVFRKWALTEEENRDVVPVTHTPASFTLDQWQKWASPVWMDIDQTDVLNVRVARDDKDEKHMCIARGGLVLTGDGYIPIEDLTVGQMVLTHRGRWRAVTAKRCMGVKRVVKLEAQGVANLQLTPDHRVWLRKARTAHPRKIARGTAPEWVMAADSIGSYVHLPMPPTGNDSLLTQNEWWIVGRWLGDGHRDDLGKRLRTVIDRCGTGAHGKRLPVEALSLDAIDAEALLSGYLSADGHYVAKYDRWTASSVSRPLLLGMALIAQRARGVVASVYAGRKARVHKIRGREVRSSQDWVLSIPPKNVSAMLLGDGAWKKVRKISEASSEVEVWDLQVDEDESFVVEGCVVHNCPLQLDLIERCQKLWSNPGEVVLSPFGGIASEGYVALKSGRKFVGVELKDSYFARAVLNLRGVVHQGDLFSRPEAAQ